MEPENVRGILFINGEKETVLNRHSREHENVIFMGSFPLYTG
jgi:hypothetical protein